MYCKTGLHIFGDCFTHIGRLVYIILGDWFTYIWRLVYIYWEIGLHRFGDWFTYIWVDLAGKRNAQSLGGIR